MRQDAFELLRQQGWNWDSDEENEQEKDTCTEHKTALRYMKMIENAIGTAIGVVMYSCVD